MALPLSRRIEHHASPQRCQAVSVGPDAAADAGPGVAAAPRGGPRARVDRDLARVIDGIDWIKHESADSISAPARGFVQALGDLMRLHPELLARHGLAVRYQVARHLKTQVGLRRAGATAATLLENARVPHFRYSLVSLAAAYWQGRSIRRQMIRVGLSGTAAISAHEIRSTPLAVPRAA